MIKDTTCEVEETKILTIFKETPREHNFDYNGALRYLRQNNRKLSVGDCKFLFLHDWETWETDLDLK